MEYESTFPGLSWIKLYVNSYIEQKLLFSLDSMQVGVLVPAKFSKNWPITYKQKIDEHQRTGTISQIPEESSQQCEEVKVNIPSYSNQWPSILDALFVPL